MGMSFHDEKPRTETMRLTYETPLQSFTNQADWSRDTWPPPPALCVDWMDGLPVLSNGDVTLREVHVGDAPSLLTMVSSEEVARFIAPPPTTVAGYEQFILWANAERAAGRYACFGIVPKGLETAVGLFQVRPLEPGFETAEWGFALGSPFWGTGVFMSGAAMVLDFAFDAIGVHRLEARSATPNGRGNGALRKLGAVCEGTLRRGFARSGMTTDQHLWTLLDCEWRKRRMLHITSLTTH